ncbi:MAG: hypothetical protein ABII88_08370 [Candidatus Omnitrophota bacterium]
MTNLNKIALNISNILFAQQVIAEDQRVTLAKVDSGSFESKWIDIDTYRHGKSIKAKFYFNKKKLHVVIYDKEEEKKVCSVCKGDFFRLPLAEKNVTNDLRKDIKIPSHAEVMEDVISLKKQRYFGKTSYILKKFFGEWRDTRQINIMSYLRSRKRRQNLDNLGGVTFLFISLKKHFDKIEIFLKSYDLGGIIDFNLDSESSAYPPQVPGDHYVTIYAAYCFLRCHATTGDKEFLKSAKLAMDFMIRIYSDYLASSIAWQNTDFKNPVFVECVKLLSEDEDVTKYNKFLFKMKETTHYQPTNVYALRVHWHSTRHRYTGKSESKRVGQCLKRLEEDQSKDGLICDNFRERYSNLSNRDITYHQYSLACLARALIYNDDPKLLNIFLKGCQFSLNLLTPDGEVAYMGRGANNIYHQVSAIYAFYEASKRTKNKTRSDQFKRAVNKAIGYLQRWVEDNKLMPTAMNQYGKIRMAWNHNATTYNALCGYFLFNVDDKLISPTTDVAIPMERQDCIINMEESNFCIVGGLNYYLGLFGGCEAAAAWSGGIHQVGIAGIAMLGIPGKGSLLPILEHLKPGYLPTTDLPFFVIDGNRKYCYGPGLIIAKKKEKYATIITYRKSFESFLFEKKYHCFSNRIIMVSKLKIFDKLKNIEVKNLSAMCARSDDGWEVELKGSGFISRNHEQGFMYNHLGVWGVEGYRKIIKTDIPSNPRGPCSVYSMSDFKLEKNHERDSIFSVAELVPFKKENFKDIYSTDECNINFIEKSITTQNEAGQSCTIQI